MPKVSVIVPNYNHGQFLEQRIQSILNQTYQDFELIYLDDASTDNSNEVFTKFSTHSKVRAIINTTNSGSPFRQWNRGIKHASGEYIWIAESDDYADSRFLEALVPLLENNPQIGIAYCKSHQINEKDELVSPLIMQPDALDRSRWQNDFINNGIDECRNYLAIRNTIPNASAVLTRRELFEKIGYADESMFLCGDWLTWIKLLLHSDVAFTAQPLNFWRTHSSTVRSRARLDGRDIYERMKVLSFIQTEIGIPRRTERQIKNRLVEEWISFMWNGQEPFNLNKVAEFCNSFRGCDPHIEFRFIEQMMFCFFKRLSNKTKITGLVQEKL